MTTAAELGIEVVQRILPNYFGDLPAAIISLPRVKCIETEEKPTVVGRHDDGFSTMVTPIGARPQFVGKKFSPKFQPVVIPKPADPPPKPLVIKHDKFRTNIDKIIDMSCIMFGCTKPELKGRGHAAYLVNARLYVSVRLRNEYGLSTPHIGRILDRDHTSILNLLRRADGIPTTKIGGVVKRRKLAGSLVFPVDCVLNGKAA